MAVQLAVSNSSGKSFKACLTRIAVAVMMLLSLCGSTSMWPTNVILSEEAGSRAADVVAA